MALIEDDMVFKNLFGYGGITPQLCKDCVRVNDNVNKTVTLSWRNPKDTWLNNQLISSWASTWIVKKKGSYPEAVYDGERITNSTLSPNIAKDVFVDSSFADDEDVTDYYYMAFPVADTGAMSVNSSNRFQEYIIYGFIEHMDILDPDSRIEYTDQNEDFKPAYMDYSADAFVWGSWADWWWNEANLPYMVGYDGRPDYQLNPDNYRLKADGSVSDVTNTSYEGGAYSWIPRIYKYEKIVGNDRIVKFCDKKVNDDYKPNGFLDAGENLLEGLWLPMFYGTVTNSKMRSIGAGRPENSATTDTQYGYITNAGTRHAFLGGPIMETLKDIEYMLAKSTNIQEKFGAGYNTGGSQASSLKDNQVIDGGSIYGKNNNTSLGKIFHSMALGSYQIWLRDPYYILKNGVYYLGTHYIYDPTGSKYENTGTVFPSAKTGSWVFPSKYALAPEWGAVPVEFDGTSALGACDGVIANVNQVSVGLRLGDCHNGLQCGPGAVALNFVATYSYWNIGSADLLLPPVGVSAAEAA